MTASAIDRRAFAAAAGAALTCAALPGSVAAQARGRAYKILHIMSYHSPWRWTDDQWAGFREAMRDVTAEYRVFQMDTKQNSSPEAKERKGREAAALIDAWKPDLVYTTDDDAQAYVTRHYVNTPLPFVFSGVNADPTTYGFVGSRNVTGVLEVVHVAQSVRLLQAIVPAARRIAAVFDGDTMWNPVRAQMEKQLAALPGTDIVAWDAIGTFAEYKRKIAAYPGHADAIALIGIFNFKDERGANVPYRDVLRWTSDNSRLPDFGFWDDRVRYGTLCAATVAERAQGFAAGRIARAILAEGKSPSSFPMAPTDKGRPVISLARANRLGIKVKSGLLLSAEIVQTFEWDR